MLNGGKSPRRKVPPRFPRLCSLYLLTNFGDVQLWALAHYEGSYGFGFLVWFVVRLYSTGLSQVGHWNQSWRGAATVCSGWLYRNSGAQRARFQSAGSGHGCILFCIFRANDQFALAGGAVDAGV
jgi:hypothetical protein